MTDRCHAADHAAYCTALPAAVDAFADLVAAADPATPVPSCPGWTLFGLARHVGGAHRWARVHVARRAQERIPFREVSAGRPDDPAALPAWLRAGVRELCGTLAATDGELPVWGWGADRHARFWGRRMLFETLVHHADAALALGLPPPPAGGRAPDGVDEFLENLPHAVSFAPRVAELTGAGERLALHATDAGTTWEITLRADGFGWTHGDGAGADATVAAVADELLLFVYGRRRPGDPSLAVAGDETLVTAWLDRSAT